MSKRYMTDEKLNTMVDIWDYRDTYQDIANECDLSVRTVKAWGKRVNSIYPDRCEKKVSLKRKMKGICAKNHKKGHPYCPCNNKECPVRASCDKKRYTNQCPFALDYFNAVHHKDPTCSITIYHENGLWKTIKIASTIGKTKAVDQVDNDKLAEYIKYLEALPYYNKL